MRYFEDLEPGRTFQSAREYLMSREDIIAYAEAWDPQRYHIDEAAARCSPVGKFFASALHSMAVSQKLAHESGVFEARPIIGLGITNVQFPKPVVEDDRVRGRVMVKDRRLSRSRPDAGIVVLLIELLNQHHEVVLSYEVTELVPRGPRP